VGLYPAYGPGPAAAMPAKQGGGARGQTDHAPQLITYPAKRTPQNEVTLAKGNHPKAVAPGRNP